MSALLGVLLVAAAVPVLAAAGYLAVLALCARRVPAPPPRTDVRFDVVVPAHDEESGIAATVASLRAVEYPADRFRVLVVADNCADRTAERARRAGATVLVRDDPRHRGKGYALDAAYARALADGFAEAVVVVDADTRVSPVLLGAFAARIRAGAEAAQGEYAVANGRDSWRTSLMTVAFTLFHTVRSLARERLALSCGLRGNGMCFATTLLRRIPAGAYSIVEDVEYGIALGRAGVRVWYAPDARVWSDMPARARGARSQRERWEGGRRALARKYAWPLLRDALARRDRVLADLALDLVVPPLSEIALAAVAGAVLTGALLRLGVVGPLAVACWSAALVALAVYVARGLALSGEGWRGARALAAAPVYALWKLALLVVRHAPASDSEWVRTTRDPLLTGGSKR